MALKLVSRAQWRARAPKYVNRGALSAESTCHWNGPTVKVGGKTTWSHASCAGLVRGIQNFHMDSRGWSDIAYNFLECPHGYTFEGRGLNVINGANGTNSGNRSSHAICCLAGEGNPFPETEKVGFKECVKHIDAHTLAPGTCKGHRDHKSTACPGDVRYNWVHAGMPLKAQPPAPTPDPKPPEEDDDMPAAPIVKAKDKPEWWLIREDGREHIKSRNDGWARTLAGQARFEKTSWNPAECVPFVWDQKIIDAVPLVD